MRQADFPGVFAERRGDVVKGTAALCELVTVAVSVCVCVSLCVCVCVCVCVRHFNRQACHRAIRQTARCGKKYITPWSTVLPQKLTVLS